MRQWSIDRKYNLEEVMSLEEFQKKVEKECGKRTNNN